MGRSGTRQDPRPSYAQKLKYTGVYWNKRQSPNHSPRWQSKLTGKPTLGQRELTLGCFRDNRAEYIKAAKAWDRARIALACMKSSGCKLNFARENYQDVIDMLKGVKIPKNTDAVRALVKAVALEEPLPQSGCPAAAEASPTPRP